ncbi:MAG: alpha-2-macroglobulin, partial [Bdellovibrionia bacterium]
AAVALAGDGHFGDGSTSVPSSKDLIIYSGFAPLAREGDGIENAFTIRNTTAKPMNVSVEISSKEIKSIPKVEGFTLKGNEAKTLSVPVSIPVGLKEISYKVVAKDSVSGTQDSMIAKARIEPAVPDRVLMGTLFQLDKSNEIPVQQPRDALPGKGGLRVSARETLASGLSGVKSYMEEYSYNCMEQKVSKAIVLEDREAAEKLIRELPAYLDGSGLIKFFPLSLCGDAQLSRYVLSILQENKLAIPQNVTDRVLAGLKSFIQGHTCHSWWDSFVRNKYLSEERVLAMEALSRYGQFNPDYLSTIQITPNLWRTETVTAWFHLLKKEDKIPNRDAELDKASNILRSRVNFQGSLMNVQGEPDWEAQWRLFSSRDQEALGVFGVSIEEDSWKEDAGRMARGIVARLKTGHWDTTLANAWGLTMLRKFSAKFESVKVKGETKIAAAEQSGLFNWAKNPNGQKIVLAWPKETENAPVKVKFSHSGDGKPWIGLETLSAIPLKAPMEFGYSIKKKILPVEQKVAGHWSVGDVANIELTVTAKADQAWVVVRDPVPAGASHLGTGLAGSSAILDRVKSAAPTGETEPFPLEYAERSFSSFTGYAAYLPRGSYVVSYRIRLNSAGAFNLPPTQTEAMYAPETFGQTPNAVWKVTP